MRRLAICAALLGFVTLAGGAGLAAKGEGVTRRELMDSKLGKLLMGRAGRAATLRSELNLTDAQRAAVKNVIKSHKKEMTGAVRPLVEKRRALRDAVSAEKPDESAIRRASSELGSSIGEAAVVMARVKGEIKAKANLSPQQMKKISEFRSANDVAVDDFFKQIDVAE